MEPHASDTCALCNDNFVVSKKAVKCALCMKFFHAQCGRAKDAVIKLLNEYANLKWFCDVCEGSFADKVSVEKRLQKVEEVTQKVLQHLNDAKDKNVSTYSDVLKYKGSNQQTIVLRPKNAKQTCLETKTEVTQKIKPENLSIGVSVKKQVNKGGLLIECSSNESLEKLKQEVQEKLGRDYDVKETPMARPKVLIVGVNDDDIESELMLKNKLLKQNGLERFSVEDLKVIHTYLPKKRRDGAKNVIVEVNIELYKQLMTKTKVFIGWSPCKVFEYLHVTRCYKCCKYGHVAKYCKAHDIVCPLCAGEHQISQCTSEKKKCVNCHYAAEILKIPNIDYEHTVLDKNCPAYIRALKTVKDRIAYEHE